MQTPVLDWKSRHDPRSRAYGARDLTGQGLRRAKVLWAGPPAGPLNQQGEGACVAHGWVHEAMCSPIRVDFGRVSLAPPFPNDPQALAFKLYDWCRQHDEFPGDDTDGTSVLQGAKGMKMLGLIRGYRWCFSLAEVVDAILALGPVVLGIPWYDGMYETVGDELVVSGRVVGGHCILAVGYDPLHLWADGSRGPGVALLNSWGPEWGVNGVAWIRADRLAALLADRGEACIPVGRSYGRAKVRATVRRALLRVKAYVTR